MCDDRKLLRHRGRMHPQGSPISSRPLRGAIPRTAPGPKLCPNVALINTTQLLFLELYKARGKNLRPRGIPHQSLPLLPHITHNTQFTTHIQTQTVHMDTYPTRIISCSQLLWEAMPPNLLGGASAWDYDVTFLRLKVVRYFIKAALEYS